MMHTRAADPEFATPDFAYPEKVKEMAEKELKQADAMSNDQGAARLRAVEMLIAADNAIDPDSRFDAPALIAKQLEAPGLSKASQAMLLIFMADAYKNIYTNNEYAYNKVDAPLLPRPADISTWSGDQFRTCIIELMDSAATLADATPLANYAAGVAYDEKALMYVPTVADFVNLQRLQIYDNLRYGTNTYREQKKEICKNALATTQDGSAPFFFWTVKALNLENSPKNVADKLLELYTNQYITNEDARYLLLNIAELYDDNYDDDYDEYSSEDPDFVYGQKIADLIEKSLKDFPHWYDNAALQNSLSAITVPNINVDVDNYLAPGKDFAIKIEYCYAKTIEIAIYPVSEGLTRINGTSVSKNNTKVYSQTVNCTEKIGKATLTARLPLAGKYAVVSYLNGEIIDDVAVFTATPLLAIAFNGCQNQAVATVDFTTGAPLGGVEVFNNQKVNRVANKSKLGTTDKNGILVYKAPETKGSYRHIWLSFKHQGTVISLNNSIERPTYNQPDTTALNTGAVILTDRALYHPGDTINWAVIAYSNTPALGKGNPLVDSKLEVTLYDANGIKVDSLESATDAFGRICGSFATRKGVLTGSYRISVTDGKRLHVSNWPMVSDFKAPTFEAEVTSVSRDVPQKGDVTLRGKATTYAGMPVVDANIAVKINGAHRWRFFSPAIELGQLSGKTNAEGAFEIVVPGDMLNQEVGRDEIFHNFVALITVTNPAAETATCTKNFSTGKPYILSAELPSVANLDKDITLNVNAFNADGVTSPIAFRWSLSDEQKTAGLPSGTGTSGTPLALELDKLAAGDYTLVVEPVDSTLADAAGDKKIQLYSLRHNTLPASVRGLFMPERNAAVKGNKATVTIGTNAEKMYVYIAVRTGNELHPVRVQTIRKGFNTIKIDLPAGSDRGINIAGVYEGNTYLCEPVLPAHEVQKVVLETESFRDRLTPGAAETWSFRLKKGDTAIADAAMIATMYNRSLDALQRASWPSRLISGPYTNNLWLDYIHRSESSLWGLLPFKYLDTYILEWPEFRFAERIHYAIVYGARSNGAVKMKNMSFMADYNMKVEATSARAEADEEEYDNVIVVAAGNVSEDLEEDATTENDANFDYRDAEVLQALWAPSLSSDADGNIVLSFTVPNANTSWQFKAFAWDKTLTCDSYNNMAVSSKPIMVQPALPRFLRAGDRASVMTTVYNRTDSERTINTTIELFDLETGKVLRAGTSMNRVPAMGSTLVAFPVSATMNAAAVGFRVRATSEGFTDGEQAAIPILPSSATLIESTTFYLNPGQKSDEQITVKPNNGASVTLQYCQNPIWTVVRAMRGISGTKGTTSTHIVSQLFSALIAKHIVATNPDIAAVIEQWKVNPSEDALTSMLSQNEELKTLLLEQTPWVQAANSNTARMEALVQLLDPENANRAIGARKTDLLALQCSDGGFAWGPWYKESSIWATEQVLITMGLARSLGTDISDFDMALQSAYKYLQAQATRTEAHAVSSDLALIATLFPDYKVSVAASKVIRKMVADIAANWKKDGTVAKAYDLLILKGNGRQTEAQKVLASLRQFGVVKDGQGMCFPSVSDMRGYATIIQAFAAMNAPASELDAMRQWIIVQAQALDDLGAYNPDYIIAAVLLTGSDWTSIPVSQSISLNGQTLELGNGTAGAGYLSYTKTADGNAMTFTVKPNGTTPSYGSVITIDNREASDVQATGIKGLSIEKRFLVYRNEKWVSTRKVKLGEKVRVQLTVKADRNLEYVTITDLRAAGLQPVDQLPGFVWDGSLAFYRENLDAETHLFVSFLPKGTYHIAYDMTASTIGSFTSGIASLQSALAPELTAHSSGNTLTINSEDE